jgi:hypothetical protein
MLRKLYDQELARLDDYARRQHRATAADLASAA